MHLLVPRKTPAARELLQASRQSLAPGLRMLLITIDGRRTLADLMAVAQGLGLTAAAFGQLRAEGLIAWEDEADEANEKAQAAAATATAADKARRLVRAKFFAMDLAARMLAGRDQELRERARGLDTESKFHLWLGECATAIAAAGSEERAALFLERVAAAG